ncbi:MAG: hypothetical protein Q8Q05_01695 [bacterium]|nr:hypothetical protein [bacterium]
MLAILIVLGFVCAIGSLLLFAHLASYPEPRGPKPKGLTMFFLGMAALTFFTAALLVSAIGSSSQKPAFQDGSPNRVEPFSFGGKNGGRDLNRVAAGHPRRTSARELLG